MRECDIQQNFMEHATNTLRNRGIWPAPCVHAYTDVIGLLPNKKRPPVIKQMEKMGYTNGWPDVFFAIPAGQYHGIALEFKRPGCVQSQSQEMMERLLISLGYLYHLCDDAREGACFFDRYLEYRDDELWCKKNGPDYDPPGCSEIVNSLRDSLSFGRDNEIMGGVDALHNVVMHKYGPRAAKIAELWFGYLRIHELQHYASLWSLAYAIMFSKYFFYPFGDGSETFEKTMADICTTVAHDEGWETDRPFVLLWAMSYCPGKYLVKKQILDLCRGITSEDRHGRYKIYDLITDLWGTEGQAMWS